MKEIAKTYRIDIGTFGHAGDGNLHPTILTDRRDTEEFKRVEEAIEAIFDKALGMGPTLSGEHGIAKASFLEKEAGFFSVLFPDRLALFRILATYSTQVRLLVFPQMTKIRQDKIKWQK